MAYNGSGTFLINSTGNPVVTGTTISSTWANNLAQDLAGGLSTAITKDGQTTVTNNIPLGNNKITGLANGTDPTDAAAFGQLSSFGVPGYTTTVTAAGTTTLFVTSTSAQFFTGITTQTVVLPVTSTLVLGFIFKIVNDSTGIVTVNSSGANLVALLPANTQILVTCILTSGTDATSWDVKFDGFTSETGTGAVVRGTTPTITTPIITTPTIATSILANFALSMPGGRVTISTGVPVMTSTVSGAATVYYTPYLNSLIPTYDGTNWTYQSFSELSQATTDTTKSPAAVANNSNYDIFVWSDSGTLRATRGPAWTSDTARGTGAATTELQQINGVWTNKIAITNGPAANKGTYVGTVRSNGTATIDFIFGAVASNGTAASFEVWNMYNRVLVATGVGDTTDSWTYSTGTWRSANASATMRASFVRGMNEDSISAKYNAYTSSTSTNGFIGIGLDATNAYSGTTGAQGAITANVSSSTGFYDGIPGLGLHFVQAVEFGNTGVTFYGDVGSPTIVQNLLSYSGRL